MDKLLENHCFSVYSTSESEGKITCRARMVPLEEKDTQLHLATVWGTKFIQAALRKSAAQEAWKLDVSKPLLLKDGELVYTWEFCLSGNVSAAVAELREIDRAPLESKSLDIASNSAPLGPPTPSKRNVTIRASQG